MKIKPTEASVEKIIQGELRQSTKFFLNLPQEDREYACIVLLKHYHAFNLLDQRLVKSTGVFFKVDAEKLAHKQGITYDIT